MATTFALQLRVGDKHVCLAARLEWNKILHHTLQRDVARFHPLASIVLLQNDTKKLAEAKQLVYLKGFTDGVLIVGDYAGKKVGRAWWQQQPRVPLPAPDVELSKLASSLHIHFWLCRSMR